MHALESDLTDGQWKPGDQLPARSALAQRYGFTAARVMRAQDELLRAGVLRKGSVYGKLSTSAMPTTSRPPERRSPLPPALMTGAGAGR
jgi:DNA-binding transcriptional MocR family regulator